jgi:hypothetical protein
MPKTQTMALFLQGKCPILPLQETSIAASVELRRDSISARVLSLSLSVRRTRCVDRCLKTAPAHTFEATRMKPGSVKQRAALSLSKSKGFQQGPCQWLTRHGSREWVICCRGRGAGLSLVRVCQAIGIGIFEITSAMLPSLSPCQPSQLQRHWQCDLAGSRPSPFPLQQCRLR